MTASPTTTRIGLFGGSFDPIHVGHLALLRAAEVALDLSRIILMPTGRSWQKSGQRTPAGDRLAMTRLAVRGHDRWEVDDREVRRDGPSYTVDTLRSLRAELGPDVVLVLLLGSDQLHNLHTWDRHTELFELANLAITRREQVALRDFPPPVEALVVKHGRDALSGSPAGELVFFSMPAAPVSSTRLRQALAAGEPVAELIPAAVLDYIRLNGLYRPT
ncbi:MAG: nicotinate (nicotinamide) nucleotide adenylyltransferase [Burkholderiaceae bacterium]